MDGRTDRQTDGHGETSIPPYNFAVGGIISVFQSKYTTVFVLLDISESKYIMEAWQNVF